MSERGLQHQHLRVRDLRNDDPCRMGSCLAQAEMKENGTCVSRALRVCDNMYCLFTRPLLFCTDI